MFTPQEYTRYNALKAVAEFGHEMSPEEFREARKRKLAWIREVIRGYGSVGDYGSGSGWLEDLCRELSIPYKGIDEIAQRGALASMEPVDLLVSITVLEHMSPQEVARFIDGASEKCRDLLIVTNNPRCAFSHYVLWDDITHVRLYTEDSVMAFLKAKGWAIKRLWYEDSVLRGHPLWRRMANRIMGRLLGPMYLSNQYNYWCVIASAPVKMPRPQNHSPQRA